MKTKNLLLAALVTFAHAISSAQTFSVGGETITAMTKGDSIKQARVQALINSGKTDSIAKLPAAGPAKDTASVAAKDSVKADTAASIAAINPPVQKADDKKAEDAKSRESEIGINQRWGLNGTLWTWILGILGCGIIMLFRTNGAKALGGTIKNWCTIEDPVVKAERKAAIIKIKVKSKAEAIEKIGKACGAAETAVGKEKITFAGSKDLRNFIDWMLEGKRFLRWNWMMIIGTALGCGLLFVLFVFAKNPHVTIINQLPAAVTPSVATAPDTLIEEDPIPAYREPVSNRDNQTVATTAPNQAMNVYVPSEGEGKAVYTRWGDANELSEKSGYYQVVIKPGFHFRAQALGPVRLILANNSYVDYGPNDFVDLANSGLNGKIKFASLNRQATNVSWTIEPN